MRFRVARQSRTQRSAALVNRLIQAVVPKDEQPYLITDETTFFDITTLDESELADLCLREFGVKPSPQELAYPLWRLAELLGSSRKPN